MSFIIVYFVYLLVSEVDMPERHPHEPTIHGRLKQKT
jgi:hypothetical protein